jgi:hypothetical protein
MANRAGRILALAIVGALFLFGFVARAQIAVYGRLPVLENSFDRDVCETLERLASAESRGTRFGKSWSTKLQLQQTRGNPNLSVPKILSRAQLIRLRTRQRIASIITGEQRERVTGRMLR